MFVFPNLPLEISAEIETYLIADAFRQHKLKWKRVMGQLVVKTEYIGTYLEFIPITIQGHDLMKNMAYTNQLDFDTKKFDITREWNIDARRQLKRIYIKSIEMMRHWKQYKGVIKRIDGRKKAKYLRPSSEHIFDGCFMQSLSAYI